MTYEKHTTSTDALDTLGSIIGPMEKRDAIHLAVEPVVAGTTLLPGNHVRLNEVGEAMATDLGKGVGIVDPFLTGVIDKGEYFWLVVYPRQITSLRHVWEHPDFPDSESAEKSASEKWLREYIDRADVYVPFEAVVEACTTGSWRGDDEYFSLRVDEDSFHSSGSDASGSIPKEFWDHMERYIGQKMTVRPDHFSCAC